MLFKKTALLISVTVFTFLKFSFTRAQGRMSTMNMNAARFYGKVIDAKSGKPVEFAIVQLYIQPQDSAAKEKLVTGMLTASNGDFSLDSLSPFPKYILRISFMGYNAFEKTLWFDMPQNQQGNMMQRLALLDKDLGNILLQPLAIELQSVTVDGTAPSFELRIDKKVYNVEKNPVAAGGTAEDVLKNVPSVNVDIDGNVTLRNAAPQIFVDGRPTTMTPDQIPADAIESVEVITNPSAKYDASGGMAGILNIVLKKNRRIGYNGNFRAGADSRGRINTGADINIREGKINFFVSGNLNQRKSKGTGHTNRINFPETLLQSEIEQNNISTNKGFFGFGRSGFDFFIDNRNTLTIAGSFNRGHFEPVDEITTLTHPPFGIIITDYSAFRLSKTERNFANGGGNISFKHIYPREGKEFTSDVSYNGSRFRSNADYATSYFDNDGIKTGNDVLQNQKGKGQNDFYTAQADFINPLNDKSKIETGLRGSIRMYESFSDYYLYNYSSGLYDILSPQSIRYKFTDEVFAVYTTYSRQIKKFGYQAGLRAESSFYTGELINEIQKFTNNYPVSFFPSAFISYKVNEKNDMQLNYTRKINRPGFFQLLPYTDYTDSLNLSKGNPDLKPEFSNNIELSWQHRFTKKNTLLTSVYFKNTDNLITRNQVILYDSILARNVIITTYQNANSAYAYGLELTSQNTLQSWLDLTLNLNAYNSFIDGENISSDFNAEQLSWFGKLNLTFKMPKSISLQLTGEYQSKTSLQLNASSGQGRGMGGGGMGGGGGFGGGPQSTASGYIKPSYSMDAAIKYEFLKNKAASLTLNMNDVFATRINATHSENDYYIQDSWRKRDAQVLRLTLNYRFGKFDTSLFKRRNTNINMDMPEGGM